MVSTVADITASKEVPSLGNALPWALLHGRQCQAPERISPWLLAPREREHDLGIGPQLRPPLTCQQHMLGHVALKLKEKEKKRERERQKSKQSNKQQQHQQQRKNLMADDAVEPEFLLPLSR